MKPYRPPGRSRAAPDTLCQKCLKRGHFSYECSAKAQERPYAARPSRTQQLFNPTLVPELTNDVPADLLRKKGVADEELAKKQLERARKRSRSRGRDRKTRPRKHSRSMSSRSSSVSTISTNRSRSPRRETRSRRMASPSPANTGKNGWDNHTNGKRRRSPSVFSSDSQVSRVSDGMKEARTRDRNTRRRLSSYSPSPRGRRRRRELVRDDMDRSYSRSRTPPRRRSRSLSRSRGARARRSPSLHSRSRSPVYANNDRGAAPVRDAPPPARNRFDRRPSPPHPPKERSLSPFSKRLAMTNAINQGNGNGPTNQGHAQGNRPPWR